MITKQQAKIRRQQRIRATIRGTADRPRLSVSVSLRQITAQVIDDQAGRTLAAATTVGKKVEGNLTAKAEQVGAEIAAAAKKAKVKTVVFDRAGRRYHGRLNALATAARKNGLEF